MKRLSLFLLALLVSGCSAGVTASAPRDPGAITIGFSAEPANFDFTRTDGTAIPQALLYNVYEGLVKLDENGQVKPLLAESWTVSPDRLSYEFSLRPNVVFSNGSPFTADTVKFSIDRVKTAWGISQKSKMDVVSRVEPLSPTTVRVVLSRPSNNWLFDMTTRVGAMFSPDGVADLPNDPIGTGPYDVASRNRGASITLKTNPRYWGPKPAFETVYLRYFKDSTALNNALLSNGIDVVSAVAAPDSMPQFENDTRFNVTQGITNGEVVLSFNGRKAPLNDVRVRRAITQGIDRRVLLDTAWAGRGELIGSMVPRTDPWYTDLTGVNAYNPEGAKKLLAEAGQQNLNLRLRIPNLPYAVTSAQVVKSELNKIGVGVSIEPLDFPAVWLKSVFTEHDFDMSIIQHVEPRDITTFGNTKYYWGYDSPKVRQLLADADRGSQEQQVAAMREVAATLANDAAACWLFLFPNLIAAKKKVGGLPLNQISEAFDLTLLRRAGS
ncbi:ABC transporter substrate-binding protein [Allokutzneria multivorans]|uniref:ABC transporter substrate-binding protein n=1 Tax=Allokutzneria multivorans TaxID=1142134 RepID=A0ABP7TUA5_9PSEU